jgi:hypothetical protein
VLSAPTRGVLELTAVMVFVGWWAWVTWGHILRGVVPVDAGDHQFMMGRAHIIWDGVRRGKWLHWTHLWQGGDSLVDLYSVEPNLLTGLFYAVAPKGVRFVTTYSIFVIWTWWLRGVGVYYLLRRFSGPAVSLLVACASLYDVGSDVWDGIWKGTLYWGMVHNSLALTFGLFATALMVDLVRSVSGPRLFACAFLVAITACGHALGMLLVVVQAGGLAIAALVGKGPRKNAVWTVGALAAGLMLAGAWLLPFTHGLTLWGYRVALSGVEYHDLGTGLFNGKAPTGNFVTFIGLGIVAVAAAAVSADMALAATAICTILFLALSLTALMVRSSVLELLPSFLEGQPRRLLTVIKTTSLPALGWLLSLAFSHLKRPSSLTAGRVAARAVVLGLLLYGPGRALFTGWIAIGDYLVEQAPDRSNPAQRTYTSPDYDAVIAWLKKTREQDPSTTPWRAILSLKDQWRHPFWAEGINTGVPIVDQVNISSNFLTFRPREFSLEGMADWNIRYVITDRYDMPIPDLVERYRSGPLRVLESPSYDDRYIVAPDRVRVSAIKFVDDEIRFDVAGAPPEGADLQIRTAWFPRWRARLIGDGELPLTARGPRPNAKPNQDQLLVHAQNGSVVVSCDGFMPGFWPGLAMSVLSAVGLVFVAARRRRERIVDWIERVAGAASRWTRRDWARRLRAKPWRISLVIGSIVLLLAVGAAAHGGNRLALPAIEGLGGVDVSASSPSTALKRCAAQWWRGRYHCASEDVDVDSWLGGMRVGDSTEETSKLWPGTRVSMQRAGTRVRLHYSRLRLRGNVLRMRFSAWGKLEVSGSVAGRQAFRLERQGDSGEDIELPDWVPYAAALDLDIVASDPKATIIFRGDLVSRAR